MRIRMTYDLAMAAARDAANRRMEAEGRKKWNREDWNEACRVFDAACPVPTFRVLEAQAAVRA